MIEARELLVERGGQPVVRVGELSVGEELVAVMGPNGAGKTSLLLALADRLPYAGSVTRGEVWLTRTSPPKQALIQARDLVQGFGVEDPDAWLARVGYSGPDLLSSGSTGERMLVALAGALGKEGCDLLFDEPFGHLDPPHVARLAPLFQERARGDTVVFTTHDARDAAIADRVVLLNETITAQGAPEDVLQAEPLSACYEAPMRVEWTPLGPIVAAEDENP